MAKNSIEIKFGDGSISRIDSKVHRLIVELQTRVRNQTELPRFWTLNQSIDNHDPHFLDFYAFLLAHRSQSRSQLYQDLFALHATGQARGGTFLEFGATDGLEWSNSALLEQEFGWTGVLAEPSPQWHDALRENRPEATIVTDCVYASSGQTLDFFVSETGTLSTLDAFRETDAQSLSGNAAARNKKGYVHPVQTISLNDLFEQHLGGGPVDYMSVDTEGSELAILQAFDFARFGPKVVTVEHNFTALEPKLDTLFAQNGYTRRFKGHTQFDAWYVRDRA